MKKSAYISECGTYRYWLKREWDETLPSMAFVMLNPSKADAENDDHTIRRCIGFAKAWGYGGLVVVNLFAYRSTDPMKLLLAADPIGPKNEATIKDIIGSVEMVVCAWGNGPIVKKLMIKHYAYRPLKGLPGLHYLEVGSTGHPKHPARLSGTLRPISYGSITPQIL